MYTPEIMPTEDLAYREKFRRGALIETASGRLGGCGGDIGGAEGRHHHYRGAKFLHGNGCKLWQNCLNCPFPDCRLH